MFVIQLEKTDYNTKFSKIEKKIATDHNYDHEHVASQEFDRVASQN